MSLIANTKARRRELTAEEMREDQIKPGYFGTTWDKETFVWHFDGTSAVRVGIPNPDHLSKVTVGADETLHEALARLPMYRSKAFLLHQMVHPPGAYYSRMSRASGVDDPPSIPRDPGLDDVLVATLNQMRSLVGMLDAIFQAVHPTQANMQTYGNAGRNLIILACTECEAQWRGVLRANGYVRDRSSTNDFVKLLPAMRLDEYSVRLQHYPWLPPVVPYAGWDKANPTETLSWYDSYNAVKHDREGEFHRATLQNSIASVAAAWVMVAAQFGYQGVREFEDLHRYFYFDHLPRWRYSEAYTTAYAGFDSAKGPRNYPF